MDLYDFPPLFTEQKNTFTWQAQQETWLNIILQKCRDENIWRLTPSSPIFSNESIQRTLKAPVATKILEFVASRDRGEWTSKAKQEMFIYWRTPGEVATLLSNWAFDTGHKNAILTCYEIQEGEAVEELKGVDDDVLQRAITELQKRGDATAMKEDGKIVGVKLK